MAKPGGMTDTAVPTTRPGRTAWGAVAVMAMTSFVLVLAEFLPPGLLTPMAAALGITEGQAGQAVSATAFVGLLVAPTIGVLLPRLDRRALLTALAVAAAASNLAVAVAPNFVVLLLARLLLGAAIGGFWAMSLAVAARLSTPGRLGRAVMLVNTGTTVATVAGVPLAVLLGSVAGWRAVFVGVAVLSAVTAAAIRSALPAVAPDASDGLRPLLDTLRAPGIGRGLTGHVLTVLGHFAAFTYIRPALGTVPGLDAGGVAVLLAVFGAGGVVGNVVVGLVVDRHLRVVRFAVPATLAAGVAAVAAFPASLPVVVVGVAVWGLSFGAWLTVVTTWIARVAPTRMEAGGGLLVAGFQLAITIGAAAGGLLVDGLGVRATLAGAAVAAAVGGLTFGSAPQDPPYGAGEDRTDERHRDGDIPDSRRNARANPSSER